MRIVCVFRFTFPAEIGVGGGAAVCVYVCARCGAVAALRCVFVQECLRHEEACGGRSRGASLAGVLPTLYGPSAFEQTGSKYSQSKETAPLNIAPNSPMDDLRTVICGGLSVLSARHWTPLSILHTLLSPPFPSSPLPRFGDSLPQHDANHPRYVWLFINRAAAVCAKQEVTQGLESSSSSPSESGSSTGILSVRILSIDRLNSSRGQRRKEAPPPPGRQVRAGSLQPSRARPDHALPLSLPPSRR